MTICFHCGVDLKDWRAEDDLSVRTRVLVPILRLHQVLKRKWIRRRVYHHAGLLTDLK